MDELPLLFLLLLFSSFFSGAEIALFSLGAEKIQALKNKAKSQKEEQKITKLELLKADHEKLLITILLGNNVVNIAASAIATLLATDFANKAGYGQETGIVIGTVTGVMTFLILIFGEIIPKSFAHKYAIKFSLFVTPILSTLQFFLMPIVWPLSKMIKKFSGGGKQKHGLDEEELKAAIELSEKEGKIEENEKEWVEKILEFGEHSVESVMTPRSKIFAIEDNTTVFQTLKKIKEAHFSRIPIFHKDLDEIIGILTLHGTIEKFNDPLFFKLNVANLPMKKPFKVPLTMKIDTLLHKFKQQKAHLALVLDEHGGLVGLITMEDVFEEVFGEIHDEEDDENLSIHQSGKKSFICNAETELEQLENFIKEKLEKKSPKRLPWELEDENKSVGLFILEKLEKFPETGEVVELKIHEKHFSFVVKKVEEEQIIEAEFFIK
ncbi:HlyC/CorC family transporter [Candidatus Gracilibacteria bacterium]|nr:HlyC/CorC family transporter [Candidatus Gracilibacteria bacterium]